jgi:hypothetical protein
MRDEYGQGSILFSDNDLDKAIQHGKRLINSANVDNALTVEDKKQNWETFMIEIDVPDDVPGIDNLPYTYAGKDGRGVDQVFDSENTVTKLSEIEEMVTLKMYLGDLDKKPWYASVPSRKVRGEEDMIGSLTHPSLQGKNIIYIRSL